MEWSVSAKVQACRAFQIEWGRGQIQLEGIYGHHIVFVFHYVRVSDNQKIFKVLSAERPHMSNNTFIHANHVREYQS